MNQHGRSMELKTTQGQSTFKPHVHPYGEGDKYSLQKGMAMEEKNCFSVLFNS